MKVGRAGLLLLAVVGAGLAAWALLPESPSPSTPADAVARTVSGRIAFVRADVATQALPGEVLAPANPNIFIMQSSAPNPQPLIASPALEGPPAWNPAGTRIAYSRATNRSERPPAPSLFVAEADGSAPRRITTCSGACMGDMGPSWAPDGERIAFLRNGSLYVVGANGSNLEQVVDASQVQAFSAPDWSPDGNSLVFAGYERPRPPIEIYTVGADGTNLQQITECRPPHCEGGYAEPDWSPDGSTIAMVQGFAGRGDLVLLDPGDGSVEALMPCPGQACPGEDADPTWSPDGKLLVFSRGTQGESQHLFFVRRGSQPAQLTAGEFVDCCPTWTS